MTSLRTRTCLTLLLAALIIAGIGAAPASADAWSVDTKHSSVGFSVTHFFTPVTGTFHDFEITFDYNSESPEESSVEATIQIASVDTGHQGRDSDLQSDTFFAAAENPTMTFVSDTVKVVDETHLVAHGTLTMKGKSRSVALPITVLGIKEIPQEMRERMRGSKRIAGFKAELSLQRADYDVGTGNFASDAVVGSEVQVQIFIEAHYR